MAKIYEKRLIGQIFFNINSIFKSSLDTINNGNYIIHNIKLLKGDKIFDTKVLAWVKCTWISGTWYGGIWRKGTWKTGTWKTGTWEDGIWEGGTWENGQWEDGVWKDGLWKGGNWEDGIWEDGTWEGGNILNKRMRYKWSNKSPNKCEWSISYNK